MAQNLLFNIKKSKSDEICLHLALWIVSTLAEFVTTKFHIYGYKYFLNNFQVSISLFDLFLT